MSSIAHITTLPSMWAMFRFLSRLFELKCSLSTMWTVRKSIAYWTIVAISVVFLFKFAARQSAPNRVDKQSTWYYHDAIVQLYRYCVLIGSQIARVFNHTHFTSVPKSLLLLESSQSAGNKSMNSLAFIEFRLLTFARCAVVRRTIAMRTQSERTLFCRKTPLTTYHCRWQQWLNLKRDD